LTESLFWDLAARYGLPLALVGLALLTGKSGTVWRWAREFGEMQRAYELRLSDLRAEMDARMAEVRARLDESNRDRDFYRAGFFEALAKADKSLDLSTRAVGVLEKGR
jgi:hypothetical protein